MFSAKLYSTIASTENIYKRCICETAKRAHSCHNQASLTLKLISAANAYKLKGIK